MPALIIVFYALYLAIDFRATVRSRDPRAIWPCAALFCIGLALQMLVVLKARIPSLAGLLLSLTDVMFNAG